MNGPEPATRSTVFSSRHTSVSKPHSSIPSGAAIQPKGLSTLADRKVESTPSDVILSVCSSTASRVAILRQLEAERKVLSSTPVESNAFCWRSMLKTMSSAVTSRPPSVGNWSCQRAPSVTVKTYVVPSGISGKLARSESMIAFSLFAQRIR